MAEPPRRFRYDPRSGQYRWASNGRFVPRNQVRLWLDDALEKAGDRFDALAEALKSGRMDLITWEIRMRREIKNVALYSAAVSKGGWAQMSESDLGRVGRFVQDQYVALRGFARQIETGKQQLDGRLNARAQLYAQAGRVLNERMTRADMRIRGYDEERSVRHTDDSCDGCLEEEAAGWRPIGEMVAIGERQCLSRCRCTAEYRRSQEVEV